MNAFRVRGPRPEDADGIAHVHRTSWEETYRGLLPDSVIDTIMAPGAPEERWRTRLTSDEPNPVHSFVAVEEAPDGAERVIGFSGSGPSRYPEYELPGEVFALYLLRERQGRGIGRALWDASVEDLGERGLLPGLVWVLADNPTLGFYRHVGAVDLARRTSRFEEAPHLEEVALRFDDGGARGTGTAPGSGSGSGSGSGR